MNAGVGVAIGVGVGVRAVVAHGFSRAIAGLKACATPPDNLAVWIGVGVGLGAALGGVLGRRKGTDR